MAWTPIDLIVPQYVDANGDPYSGAVLKAYAGGTTTNIAMATDSGGGTTFTSIALNSLGYPSHSGSITIPHVDQIYKLALYADQAAADANTPAIWSQDNLLQIIVSGSFTVDDAVSSGVTNVITATHTTTGTPGTGIGTGIAFVAETSANNNETGMVIEAVTTDATAGSEDFDFVVKLMRAGAAVAQMFRLSSLGRLFGFTSFDLARATVASHATTADIWSVGNQIDWTGTATTTAFPAAPQAGAERVLICAGACSFTAGANMLIDGVASASTVTCAANDQVIVRAVTTTQFKLSRIKYDGTAQVETLQGTATGTIDLLTGTNIASASTVNLNTATGNRVHITGTTTITAVTLTRGPRTVVFDGILTLTHHATNNNLPSGASITTAAGDRAIYESDGTTVYCIAYLRASGQSVAGSNIVADYKEYLSSDTWSKPAGCSYVYVENIGGGGGGAGQAVGQAGSGGGGGFSFGHFKASDCGATETITIGAGGAGGTAAVGSDGANTTFGSLLTALGGKGGRLDTQSAASGDYVGLNLQGATSGWPSGSGAGTNGSTAGGDGGSCIMGGAGGGGGNSITSGSGGSSLKGGNGGSGRTTAGTATAGTQPGGGGGGAYNGTGGAGGAGRVRVWTW